MLGFNCRRMPDQVHIKNIGACLAEQAATTTGAEARTQLQNPNSGKRLFNSHIDDPSDGSCNRATIS